MCLATTSAKLNVVVTCDSDAHTQQVNDAKEHSIADGSERQVSGEFNIRRSLSPRRSHSAHLRHGLPSAEPQTLGD